MTAIKQPIRISETMVDRMVDAPSTGPHSITENDRAVLLSIRQAALIQLAAIEDYLGMRRSVMTRAEREELKRQRSEQLRERFDAITRR